MQSPNPAATTPLTLEDYIDRMSEQELRQQMKQLIAERIGRGQAPAAAAPPPTGNDAIDRLIKQLRDREDAQDAKNFRGEMGGFSDTQRAYAAGVPEKQLHRIATAAMVNRHKNLKNAGIDPQSEFVGSQRNNETVEQYAARMQEAKGRSEERKAAARAKMQTEDAARKARGPQKPGMMYGTIAEPVDKRSDAQRAADAEAFVQGRKTPQPGYEYRDFQSNLKNTGRAPLPPREMKYRALGRVTGGRADTPDVEVESPDEGWTADRGRHLIQSKLDEEAALWALRNLQGIAD